MFPCSKGHSVRAYLDTILNDLTSNMTDLFSAEIYVGKYVLHYQDFQGYCVWRRVKTLFNNKYIFRKSVEVSFPRVSPFLSALTLWHSLVWNMDFKMLIFQTRNFKIQVQINRGENRSERRLTRIISNSFIAISYFKLEVSSPKEKKNMAPYRKEQYLFGRKSSLKEWFFYKVDVLVSANKPICRNSRALLCPYTTFGLPLCRLE